MWYDVQHGAAKDLRDCHDWFATSYGMLEVITPAWRRCRNGRRGLIRGARFHRDVKGRVRVNR